MTGDISQPNWYRGTYMLAVAHATLAMTAPRTRSSRAGVARAYEGSTDPEDRAVEHDDHIANPLEAELAVKHTAEVASTLEAELVKLEARWRRDAASREFEDFLKALEPTVLVLAAGVSRRWGWSPSSDRRAPERRIPTWIARFPRLEALARRALARFGSQPRTRAPTGLKDRRAVLDALRGSTAFEDSDLIEYVRGLNLDYRARYNLACYYTGRAQEKQTPHAHPPARASQPDDYRRAFAELSAALRAAPLDLVDWAKEDPSLAGLRRHREYGPRFRKLVASRLPQKQRRRRREPEKTIE